MKTKKLLTLAAVLGALSLTAYAQDAGGPPPGGGSNEHGAGPGGQGGPGGHHPIPLIILALDANHDGIIDSNEIANASVVLKTLDKNGDGKLTRDEYMGKPPGGHGRGGPQGKGGGPDSDGPQGPPPGN